MQNPSGLLLVLAGLLFWSGCANTQLSKEAFPRSAPLLVPAPEKETRFIPDEIEIHRKPGVDFNRYKAVWVEPTRLALRTEGHQPSEKHRERLVKRMDAELARSLGRNLEVVNQAGPDTLRVRVAITDLNPQNFLFNVVTFILLVPLDSGGISAEFAITDSETDELLFAMAARRGGTPLLILEAFHIYGHAGHGMKNWAKLLSHCMNLQKPQ